MEDLHEIGPSAARAVLATAIGCDLAYDHERMAIEHATELAASILAFAGPEARWWTNSLAADTADGTERCGPPHSWTPLTTATFDTGVIGVDRDRILVAWVMDED